MEKEVERVGRLQILTPILTLGTRILLELLFKVLNPSGSISVHGGVIGHGSTRLINERVCVAV
jgi:hypothetical protein